MWPQVTTAPFLRLDLASVLAYSLTWHFLICAIASYSSLLFLYVPSTDNDFSSFAGCHWLFAYAYFYRSTSSLFQWLARTHRYISLRTYPISFLAVLKIALRTSLQHPSPLRFALTNKILPACVQATVNLGLQLEKGLCNALLRSV